MMTTAAAAVAGISLPADGGSVDDDSA